MRLDSKKYLTKDDIQDSIPGIEFYTPGDASTQDIIFRLTGATSGGVPTMVAHYMFMTAMRREYYRRVSAHGPVIRVLPKHCYKLEWSLILLRHFPECGSVLNPEKYDIEHPDFPSLLSQYQALCVQGFVSFFEYFLQQVQHSAPSSLEEVTYVELSGESLTPQWYERLQSLVPNAKFEWNIGMAEASLTGFYCDHLVKRYPEDKFRTYHPVPEFNTEVLNPDQNDIGEMVIDIPRIGLYRTGDACKIIDEKCPCGESKTLFMEGRFDGDRVSARGAMFLKKELDRHFEELLTDTLLDYRMEVYEQKNNMTKGYVRILIIPMQKNSTDVLEKVMKSARALFVTPTRTLGDVISDGIFEPIEITVVDTIPDKGKKKRLVKGEV